MSPLSLTADMPVIQSGHFRLETRRNPRLVQVFSIPLGLFVDVHDRQCQANHARQTLERLRERHGISAKEAVAILSCLPFDEVQSVTETAAHRILYAWISSFNRGGLLARTTPPPSAPSGGALEASRGGEP